MPLQGSGLSFSSALLVWGEIASARVGVWWAETCTTSGCFSLENRLSSHVGGALQGEAEEAADLSRESSGTSSVAEIWDHHAYH